MDRDALLLHQVHAVKLAADIAGSIASTSLIWRRRVPLALLAAFLPAVVASAVTMRSDLSGLRRTRRGRYVLAHMPPAAEAVRGAGQVLAWWAAFRHNPLGIAGGLAVVVLGWSHGLLTLLTDRVRDLLGRGRPVQTGPVRRFRAGMPVRNDRTGPSRRAP